MCDAGLGFSLGKEMKEVSLFDGDTKDSGYCEDQHSDLENLVDDSPLRDDNVEDSIVWFSQCDIAENVTPNKTNSCGKKKRLFGTPDALKSPTQDAAFNLKRLKLFDGSSVETEIDYFSFLTPTKKIKVCEEKVSVNVYYQEEKVKEAVEKSEADSDLIGDFSKTYILPLVLGVHPDLKSISPLTMHDVLQGKYSSTLDSFLIIDCRYPYEYNSGHIERAVNIYTKEDCLKLLEVPSRSTNKRHILIFHCEFSMERGPSMSRLLRKQDRFINSSNYPNLIYPEIYILEGGYKKFFESFPELCVPREYKQMLHPDHTDDFRYFRKKSKSADCIKNSKKNPSCRKIRKFLSDNSFE
ncbi:hypothetical protein GWI33_023271 [Rhynchophorus ferrugineus]|uniref:protein-tyrosine-phosphatase n=1 Tax=Rhynchophorus ferrugineus TaxID=354439 RepID=A0A834MHE0_RHYFE|nr:hypothetical protein GWI33_023271 [Rhynchophorus ferrugineus]